MSPSAVAMREKGFTVIELLIVVTIIGILAALGYPSYTDSLKRAHRSDIVGLLSDKTQQLERFYSRNGQYADIIGPPSVELEITPGNRLYRVIAERDAQAFRLTATPIAAGMMDGDRCGVYVVDNVGRRRNIKEAEASHDCWG
ncbi:type IV pilin protein [Pseudomonas sp. 10B1]|uniref:type IV pilin protein n=1 Tax=unclassified Pseudomonas TaxID=196821 RepID=UPI002AB42984|nr:MULTISPECIES: type IV pilin protein [unclassified Pseudomonas]MDY7561918.1 type IV pilin protein [Pseudomonas sp. AB6]MEA9993440.1 type IV pilin protein [Pseudomonas sp. AA4]MEB0088960.1 type IV pilin protein [Pseudomonas sp. RTI1]MEB0126287.1 type IV pilin protein [Pseudomonas sp. CCC1.2]MEB0155557.1 type IV pilin protein [Pseudomonas sp. CCC4.3]